MGLNATGPGALVAQDWPAACAVRVWAVQVKETTELATGKCWERPGLKCRLLGHCGICLVLSP